MVLWCTRKRSDEAMPYMSWFDAISTCDWIIVGNLSFNNKECTN